MNTTKIFSVLINTSANLSEQSKEKRRKVLNLIKRRLPNVPLKIQINDNLIVLNRSSDKNGCIYYSGAIPKSAYIDITGHTKVDGSFRFNAHINEYGELKLYSADYGYTKVIGKKRITNFMLRD